MYAKAKLLSLSCLVLTLLPSVVMATQEQDNKAGAALKTTDSTKTSSVAAHTVIKPDGTKNIVTTGSNGLPLKFPPWPPRRSFNHHMLPPPPPGPYMSTALSNTPAQVPESNRPVYSPPVMNERAEPMAMFSPDLPWPGDRVNQWRPENGGRYYAGPAFPPQHPPVNEYRYRPYQPVFRMPSNRYRFNNPGMMQPPGMSPQFRPPAYHSVSPQPYHHSPTGH